MSSLSGEVENDTQLVLDLGKYVSDLRLGQSMVEYVLNNKYVGNFTLIEALEQSTHTFGTPSDDYNITKYCSGPVSRHKMNGDHWTFLSEENVAEAAEILISLLHNDSSS